MVILEVALLRLKFLLQLKSISALHKRNEVVYLVFHKLSHSFLYCHHHLPFSIFFYHHCYSCRLNFRKMIACLCNVFHQVTLRWFTCNIFQLSFDWFFSFFLSFFFFHVFNHFFRIIFQLPFGDFNLYFKKFSSFLDAFFIAC